MIRSPGHSQPHRYKSTHLCYCVEYEFILPNFSVIGSINSILYCWSIFGDCGYLWIFDMHWFEWTGKRKIMLTEAWTRRAAALCKRLLSSERRQLQAIVRAGMFRFTHPFVCLFVSRCSRKEACEKWAEPLHFSTELKQCVDITVTPDNMSVTSASTQVIEFYMLLQKHKITPV